MSDKTPAEVYAALRKSVIQRIDAYTSALTQLQKKEDAGVIAMALKKSTHGLPSSTPSDSEIADGHSTKQIKKTVFDVMKAEDFIDLRNANDPKKRIKSFDNPDTVLPNAKPQKVIDAEGSGGDITKGKKLNKDALSPVGTGAGAGTAAVKPKTPKIPTLKPAGVPGAAAGQAPKAPKPPQAAGASPSMHKMDLPASKEKANGGPVPTSKMEIPASKEAANGGPVPANKMEMPATKEAANGGLKKDAMAAAAQPAPVPAQPSGHPAVSGGHVAMLTGENPKYPASAQGGNVGLESELKAKGLKYEPIQGFYDSPENSFLVHGADPDYLMDVGKRYGQESVLYSNGGNHQLLYTNGENAGMYHPGTGHTLHEAPPENYYSTVQHDGKPVHFTYNMDFNSLHPYQANKMEMPATKENANGGPLPTKKSELMEKAVSPVFAVRPRLGGKDPTSRQMTQMASADAHNAARTAAAAPAPKVALPTVAQHAARAAQLTPSATGGHAMKGPGKAAIDLPADTGEATITHGSGSFGDFMPAGKFGKSELDSCPCPRCKKGMTLCKCKA
ncbi:hypothetical protein [Myxococcus phage Mx1]|nr:hypothetical protein [Myxococcus phage Mx1]